MDGEKRREEREAVDLSMSGPPEKVSLQNSVKSFKGQKESD
jgi:hypothetical protein